MVTREVMTQMLLFCESHFPHLSLSLSLSLSLTISFFTSLSLSLSRKPFSPQSPFTFSPAAKKHLFAFIKRAI